MKDGVSAREVYLEALAYVKEKNPEIEKNFVKNIGFGVNAISLMHFIRTDMSARWAWNFEIRRTSSHPKTVAY
jgi:nucleosome binding factor SPN SPT16 subunit